MVEKEGAGLDAGIKLSRGQGKAVLGLKGMAVWGRGGGRLAATVGKVPSVRWSFSVA